MDGFDLPVRNELENKYVQALIELGIPKEQIGFFARRRFDQALNNSSPEEFNTVIKEQAFISLQRYQRNAL